MEARPCEASNRSQIIFIKTGRGHAMSDMHTSACPTLNGLQIVVPAAVAVLMHGRHRQAKKMEHVRNSRRNFVFALLFRW